MKIVSTSYANTASFNDPVAWLHRIDFYTGILEKLAMHHQVESIEQINYSGELKQNNVNYHFLNFKKPKLYFPQGLHHFIKRLKPDVVLVNGLIYPLQVMQLRLTLGKAVKIILLHRGEKPFHGPKRFLQRWADKMINAYLFTSAEFGKEWTAFGNIDQKKIYESIQASSVFLPQEKNAARSTLQIHGAPVFLWIGRLDANKDPLTVVKAFLQFSKFQVAARLYMIYQEEGLLKEIEALIQKDSNAGEAIKLIGKVPHQQLQDWYNAADFILSGSHHEGSGIAVCEAMSCGCIPIVTDIISFRKMTGPGKCGLLYEAGNDAALLKTLMQVVELNIEEEQKKALAQFKSELSFEAIAGKIERVIAAI